MSGCPVIQSLRFVLILAAALGAAGSAQAQARGSRTSTGPKPPPGMCRIWVDGVRADKQPAPTDCATALKNKPTNGRVIFGDPKPAVRTPGATPARPPAKADSLRNPRTSKARRDTSRY
jgi:hypothetical protein